MDCFLFMIRFFVLLSGRWTNKDSSGGVKIRNGGESLVLYFPSIPFFV